MKRIGDDVRQAFEQEQTGLGEVTDSRHRMIHAALAARDRGPSRRLQWAAGVAVVLITALVIATFELARAGRSSLEHTVPASTPSSKAVGSPTPLAHLLNVPSTTPVITYGDPANWNQGDAMTWDGKTAGKLPTPPGGVGNPANSLFASPTDITDRSGSVLASGSYGTKGFNGAWADDETHYCQMTPFDFIGANGVPATLQILTPGGAPRNVVQVGQVYENSAASVAVCSVLADRAIVVQPSPMGMAVEYWVVQLSTGKILRDRNASNGHPGLIGMVASRDGMYVAEDYSSGSLAVTPSGSIIYGPDGVAVAQLSGWVEAFNWDDSLVVEDNGYATAPVSIVSWRSGKVVWLGPPDMAQFRVEAQPGGSSLAVWIAPPAEINQGTGQQQADLYVITSDGQVVAKVHDTP